MDKARLDWDFEYHVSSLERVTDHETIRVRAHTLADFINEIAPDCREKSLAITKLEEAMFWANAAIARQDRPED